MLVFQHTFSYLRHLESGSRFMCKIRVFRKAFVQIDAIFLYRSALVIFLNFCFCKCFTNEGWGHLTISFYRTSSNHKNVSPIWHYIAWNAAFLSRCDFYHFYSQTSNSLRIYFPNVVYLPKWLKSMHCAPHEKKRITLSFYVNRATAKYATDTAKIYPERN